MTTQSSSLNVQNVWRTHPAYILRGWLKYIHSRPGQNQSDQWSGGASTSHGWSRIFKKPRYRPLFDDVDSERNHDSRSRRLLSSWEAQSTLSCHTSALWRSLDWRWNLGEQTLGRHLRMLSCEWSKTLISSRLLEVVFGFQSTEVKWL
jgi:hypothetical protein